MHWKDADDQRLKGMPHQLWDVGAGCKGGKNGNHEECSPNVDGVWPEVLLADVPIQAAGTAALSICCQCAVRIACHTQVARPLLTA